MVLVSLQSNVADSEFVDVVDGGVEPELREWHRFASELFADRLEVRVVDVSIIQANDELVWFHVDYLGDH